jgi:hypothetical protein
MGKYLGHEGDDGKIIYKLMIFHIYVNVYWKVLHVLLRKL